MIAILSPSKTQDFETRRSELPSTDLRFQQQSWELIQELRNYTPASLGELMKISVKLSDLNCARYRDYDKTYHDENSKQALLAFKGDVYTDIEVDKYSKADFEWAQHHLRIISGLYGLVRPLDRIQPYRLEMKTALKTKRGKNLYEFWGDKLMKALEKDLKEQGDDIVINLASQEYSRALNLKEIYAQVIDIVFKEQKPGKEPAIIAIYSKKARGTMANYMITKRLEKPEQIKDFAEDGYRFKKKLSSAQELVFVRKQ